MTDQIKELHSKLVSPAYTNVSSAQMGATMDLSEFAHTFTSTYISQELQSDEWTEEEKKELEKYYNKIETEYEKKKNEKEKKRKEQEQLPKTEAEAFFYNAQLLHDVNIDYKLNTVYLVSDSIINFYQLSAEGLEIYIYWRSNLRKGILLDVSTGFMCLYLKEVCGIVEHESPKEAFEHLLYLYTLTKTLEFAEKYSAIIIRAIKFVSVLYYDKIPDALVYIKKYFYDENIEYNEKKYFLDGRYELCIDYINSLSSYKFKESPFYKDHSVFYDRCLVQVMNAFVKICEDNNFNFTHACIGSQKELQYVEDFFYRNNDLWHEGKICLDNGYYVRVTNGKIVESVISRASQVNDTSEKASGMFYYLVWYLEKITRTYIGIKRNVHPTLSKLDKMREKPKYRNDFTKLKEIFLSEEFINMVDRIVKEEYEAVKNFD